MDSRLWVLPVLSVFPIGLQSFCMRHLSATKRTTGPPSQEDKRALNPTLSLLCKPWFGFSTQKNGYFYLPTTRYFLDSHEDMEYVSSCPRCKGAAGLLVLPVSNSY